jgi:hypothetical protein
MEWCVYDTWMTQWCPEPAGSYLQALRSAERRNEGEEIGSRRYQPRRLEEEVPVKKPVGSLRPYRLHDNPQEAKLAALWQRYNETGAQLDPRTVKRAFEHGIDSLQSDHSKARLRAALKKMKFEGLITPARRGRPPA